MKHRNGAKPRICPVSAMAEKRNRPERQYKLKGDVIAARMKEKTFSIAALADQLEVNVSTVGRWLKGGKAYMRNIDALAKALDLPAKNLLEGFVPDPQDRIQISIKISIPPDLKMPEDAREAFVTALANLINASDKINDLGIKESARQAFMDSFGDCISSSSKNSNPEAEGED
jgi:transcriptional regulator with XRE-family HTH domain